MKNYFAKEIQNVAGYVPGEQPVMKNLIKLNTNENPYPPSPKVAEALKNFDYENLRRYPNPTADGLRKAIAARFGVKMSNVVVGNGSDELLSLAFKAFGAPDLPISVMEPSYSLYPVLAALRGAPLVKIPLNNGDFSLPDDLLEQIKNTNAFILTRPNAPTGTLYPKARVEEICQKFGGVVIIDEAYVDFASDNCMDLAVRYPNVMVMRTFSKSYSLAGLRLGYAVADEALIDGFMTLKDSYNVNVFSQVLGLAAFEDEEYLRSGRQKIIESRQRLTCELEKMNFVVAPSQSNFIFAQPPDKDGEKAFKFLRERAIVVRYFPGPVTGSYLRITIGTWEEMQRMLDVLRELYQ